MTIRVLFPIFLVEGDWYGFLIIIQVRYVLDNDSREVSNLEPLFFHKLSFFLCSSLNSFIFHWIFLNLILCSFHFILIKLWKAFLRILFWLIINFKVFFLVRNSFCYCIIKNEIRIFLPPHFCEAYNPAPGDNWDVTMSAEQGGFTLCSN